MKRFYGVVGALMLVALPVYAAQATKPADKAAAKTEQAAKPATEKAKPAMEKMQAGKPMTAAGEVSAVAADSLTINTKAEPITFTVDSKTKVIEPGASHKAADMKAKDKPTVITDFVKVGDNVTVTYHEKDGAKVATSVRVRPAKPVK